MDEEKRERLEPREAPDVPGDRLRQRIAEARETISRGLRDVVDRLQEQQDVAARATEEQITRRANERLDAAIADFEVRVESALAEARRELAAQGEALKEVERRVTATERRIASAVDTAVRAADWESRLVAAVQVEEEVARRIADAERRLLRAINEPRPPAAPAD